MKKDRLPTAGTMDVPTDGTALADAYFCRVIIGVLLVRLGTSPTSITQADLDAITGLRVLEGHDSLGNFVVGLGYPVTTPEKQQ